MTLTLHLPSLFIGVILGAVAITLVAVVYACGKGEREPAASEVTT